MMSASSKLILVKTLHTLIWIFFNLVLIYMFYAVLTDQVDYWFWIGMGFIGVECIVLIINNWTCPLTPIARRYTDSTKDNFDIYLPNWLAKYNIAIYTVILVVVILIYFFRV